MGNIPGMQIDYVKAMVTAFDGLLSAEKKLNITAWTGGKLPKISVTWSDTKYCPHAPPATDCAQAPGIGAMASVYQAVQDPSVIGYAPKNDIKGSYAARWVNSLNAFVRADQLQRENLGPASAWPSLKGVKVYLGEWTPANPINAADPGYKKEDLQYDLKALYSKTQPWSSQFMGVSYFEFQRAYNRPDVKDSSFGLFKLTPAHPWHTSWIQDDSAAHGRPINCLDWKDSTAKDFAQVIADAFGGTLPTLTCPGVAEASAARTEATYV